MTNTAPKSSPRSICREGPALLLIEGGRVVLKLWWAAQIEHEAAAWVETGMMRGKLFAEYFRRNFSVDYRSERAKQRDFDEDARFAAWEE